MAKLNEVLDPTAHGALSPTLRELYTERGGKFYLDTDGAEGQRAALEAERQARKVLEDRLKGFGDLTPEQVKALNEGKAKAEREKDFAAGNFEKILAEERAKHGKDLELREKADERRLATLKAALIDAEATRALVANGGNPDLLLPIIQAKAKLESAGDREVAVVIGEKGGPLLKAGAQKADEFMSIHEYVATVLKPDKRYAGAFASERGSGSGGTLRPTGRPITTPTTGKIAEAIKRGDTVLTKDM